MSESPPKDAPGPTLPPIREVIPDQYWHNNEYDYRYYMRSRELQEVSGAMQDSVNTLPRDPRVGPPYEPPRHDPLQHPPGHAAFLHPPLRNSMRPQSSDSPCYCMADIPQLEQPPHMPPRQPGPLPPPHGYFEQREPQTESQQPSPRYGASGYTLPLPRYEGSGYYQLERPREQAPPAPLSADQRHYRALPQSELHSNHKHKHCHRHGHQVYYHGASAPESHRMYQGGYCGQERGAIQVLQGATTMALEEIKEDPRKQPPGLAKHRRLAPVASTDTEPSPSLSLPGISPQEVTDKVTETVIGRQARPRRRFFGRRPRRGGLGVNVPREGTQNRASSGSARSGQAVEDGEEVIDAPGQTPDPTAALDMDMAPAPAPPLHDIASSPSPAAPRKKQCVCKARCSEEKQLLSEAERGMGNDGATRNEAPAGGHECTTRGEQPPAREEGPVKMEGDAKSERSMDNEEEGPENKDSDEP
ncbi:hypothetical protein MKZ38_002890 [Zalerion maritima]|uniref:Uncharacterized protein n=1 Tax=Zalerion maritima TaxID=339359 RepID=A0AAD5WWR8_9PEZI|nr:hypothetical protein MKZ38_002890 [Zalerion maritima]